MTAELFSKYDKRKIKKFSEIDEMIPFRILEYEVIEVSKFWNAHIFRLENKNTDAFRAYVPERLRVDYQAYKNKTGRPFD